jgi:RNA polymerase sigma-70 factor (ECF subfamily)
MTRGRSGENRPDRQGPGEGRASIRTWLYRIATNRCLNALRWANRRPAKQWDVPEVEPPEPTQFGEVVWLEPYPDALTALDPGVSPTTHSVRFSSWSAW